MITNPVYRDRREAGCILARHIRERLGPLDNLLVLALPRGGVPVGLEVARALDAPLDIFLVRKLGIPGRPEFAMGAIAAGGFEVLDHAMIARLGLSPFEIAVVADCATAELRQREERYRARRPAAPVRGRTIVLVDDGIATGFTLRAAIAAVRACEPGRIVVAAPVGAADTCAALADEVDAVICPLQPETFHAVGEWYERFEPTTDAEVCGCLATAAMERAESGRAEPAALG